MRTSWAWVSEHAICAIGPHDQLPSSRPFYCHPAVARGARLTLLGIGQPRVGNKAWVGYIHHLAQPLEDAGLLRVYRLIDNVDLIW